MHPCSADLEQSAILQKIMILMVLSMLSEDSNQPPYVCAYVSMTKATGFGQDICCLCTASLAWGRLASGGSPLESLDKHSCIAGCP